MKQKITFSMLKPDAISRKISGKITQYFEDAGFTVVASKIICFSEKTAADFYIEHKNRPFFQDLIQYITKGPVLIQVLYRENAVEHHRKVIGATDPQQAEPGTIRKDLATSIDANLVHGSDSDESSKREIAMFFSQEEIFIPE